MPRLLALNALELLYGWFGVLLGALLLMSSVLIPEPASGGGIWPAFVVILGVIALIVGFVVLPVVLSLHALSTPACILEGLGAGRSARRSVELLKGTPWQPSGHGTVWLLLVVVGFLLLMLMAGVGTSVSLIQLLEREGVLLPIPVLGVVVEKATELLPWFLAIWSLVPVWCVTTTILYYDRRVRLEGYDIETLAREVWRTDRQSRFEL
jgi:hypothetical protein